MKNSLMRPFISGSALLLALCLAGFAQAGRLVTEDTGRLLSLENAWNQAELKHDVAAVSLLIGDEFQYTDSDGTFMNRDRWLAYVKSAADQYEQLGNSGMKVRVYGNAAVVTGTYHEKIKIGGKWVDESGRFTDMWIQQNGEWKCVASQATLISH